MAQDTRPTINSRENLAMLLVYVYHKLPRLTGGCFGASVCRFFSPRLGSIGLALFICTGAVSLGRSFFRFKCLPHFLRGCTTQFCSFSFSSSVLFDVLIMYSCFLLSFLFVPFVFSIS